MFGCATKDGPSPSQEVRGALAQIQLVGCATATRGPKAAYGVAADAGTIAYKSRPRRQQHRVVPWSLPTHRVCASATAHIFLTSIISTEVVRS